MSTVLGPIKRHGDVSPRSTNWYGPLEGMTMHSVVKDPQGFNPQAVTIELGIQVNQGDYMRATYLVQTFQPPVRQHVYRI